MGKKQIVMGKIGVKNIVWNRLGKVYEEKSSPNLLVIEAGVAVGFVVNEWFEATSDVDRKKSITWFRLSGNRKVVFFKGEYLADRPYLLTIDKANAGKNIFYLEASLTGVKDFSVKRGLYIRAYCPPRVVRAYWQENTAESTTQISSANPTKYNVPLLLHIDVEGLSGYKCTAHIYNFETDANGGNHQKISKTYTQTCIDGNLDFEIPACDILKWKNKTGTEKSIHKFYIQLTAEGNTEFIKDGSTNGSTKDATELYIKNKLGKIISKEMPLPQGNKFLVVEL